MNRSVDDVRAGLRISQAEAYFADLLAWDAGDTERFGRMVVSGGEGSGASPERWAMHIAMISGETYVAERHHKRLVEMLEWLQERNLYEYR